MINRKKFILLIIFANCANEKCATYQALLQST